MPPRPTIAVAIEHMRSDESSCSELIEHCLQRIASLDNQIHAWAFVDQRGARAAAADHDRQIRDGNILGPLHGIPIGVKDIIDVAGMPTVAGAPWRAGHIAERDAPLVARLRAAGAVILGKTVTTQFAYIDPAPTRNPWNLAHTPGGSSSGSAAAVAAEMCWGAIGTQTGGSVIRPAAYCGIVGVKPTFGSIDTAGVLPLSPPLDTVGVMANGVDDARIVLAMIQGNELAAAPPDRGPPALGFIDEFFMAWAEEPVQEAVETAMDAIRTAGAKIHAVSLPASFTEVQQMHYRIMAHGAAETHREQFAHHASEYAPRIAELIREGQAFSADDLQAALTHQRRFAADMAARFATGEALGQILVMPATVTHAPPDLDTTGDPRFNSPWTYAGLPVVTVRCGLTDDGLPVGLQLVGPQNGEEQLLAAAAWCERMLKQTRHCRINLSHFRTSIDESPGSCLRPP
jgi:aspartyl-tRNA(Asn)/glutamyl-tRNA(Gln) amidotransferase subunit A